jgi:hypothetical protein
MKIAIEPVRKGTGDPSPENVRPITGWTGCNVTRTGKNLIPNNYSSRTINGVTFSVNNDGSISVSGTPTGNATFVMTFDVNAELGVVVLNGIDYATNIRWDTVILLTANKETIVTFGQTDDKERIIDLSQYPTVARMSVVFKRKVNDAEVSGTVYPMLRKQSETAEWEPYLGTTYPITFPGTVYGGNLTIHADGTGELVVDKHLFTVDENTTINKRANVISGGTLFDIILDINPSDRLNSISNLFKFSTATSSSNLSAGEYIVVPDGGNNTRSVRLCWGKPSAGSTVEELKEMLAENPSSQFMYNIAPSSYQLTAPQVRTLLGLNHIWADTGDIESITYPTDGTIRIDNVEKRITSVLSAMVAPVLTGMIADTALAVNQFRIVNDTLYKVTAPIASGGMMTPGTNVIATSIGEQITALLNA